LKLSSSDDVPGDLAKAWLDPRGLDARLGGSGYTVPQFDPQNWLSLDGYTQGVPGLTVTAGGNCRNNWIHVPRSHRFAGPTQVVLAPNTHGNALIIAEGAQTYGQFQFRGNGNVCMFGGRVGQPSYYACWLWGNDGLIFCGQGTSSNGVTFNLQGDGSRIVVGDDCMFARAVNVRNSDMHALVDMETGGWLNPAADVTIEPHVWVAEDAWVLKGCTVGFGSVIGGKSLVNVSIPRFSLVAGIPAKVLRSGVTWDRLMRPQPDTVQRLKDWERSLTASPGAGGHAGADTLAFGPINGYANGPALG
jgi:acetyltransferase-like isoleucine patch superfamily enzyme